jgi:FAD:protein FMN transferase
MCPTACTWFVALAAIAAPAELPLTRFAYEQTHMGVPFAIVLYAADESTANKASTAAYARIAALDAILSDYNPDSELSRLSDSAGSGQVVPLSEDLGRVLRVSQDLAERSDGAFDVTVGPLVRLWRRARRQHKLPGADDLAAARAAVGYQHLRLGDNGRTARLLATDMRLDLGGIGMGYAVDQALAVLREHGINRAMIDASGDIGLGDPPPDAAGWRIGVAPLAEDGTPSRFVLLSNAAITTSGDAFQHVEIDGRRYSHIVDPHTGLGLTDRLAVSVVSADCTTADSLATAACVLGVRAGFELIEATPGTAALFVRQVDDQVTECSSRDWNKHVILPR